MFPILRGEVMIVMREEEKGPETGRLWGPELEKEVDSLCAWAAVRAAAVVIAPVAGTAALIANEVYLVKKIGDEYGQTLNDSVILGFIASLGASVAGGTLATLFPWSPAKAVIAAGLTYGVGKAAHEWLKAGRPEDPELFREVFRQAKRDMGRKIRGLLERRDSETYYDDGDEPPC